MIFFLILLIFEDRNVSRFPFVSTVTKKLFYFDRQFLVFYMITTLKYDLHVVLFLYQFLIGTKVLHFLVVNNSFNILNFSSYIG